MITERHNFGVDDLHRHILDQLPPDGLVLDVGAGLAKYHELLVPHCRHLTLVDAHMPYLEDRAIKFPTTELRAGNALEILPTFGPQQYDLALAIDFLEHLTIEEADYTILLLMRCARKIAVFVPEGNHPQSRDAYGMGGDHWQTHRSTWDAEMLVDLGFTVERWLDFHAHAAGCDPHALWATWNLAL